MKKIVTVILFILLVIAFGTFAAYSWYNNVINSEVLTNELIEVTVVEGDTLISILPQLAEKGLIPNPEVVKVYIRLNNISANIKAGTYSINKGTNVPNIIETLEKGSFKASISITIPEGMRYEAIGRLLSNKIGEASDESKFIEAEFLAICADPDSYNFDEETERILFKYKPAGKPLRGLLFPDTYRFDFDTDAITVIEAMIKNLDKRLLENNINETTLNDSQSNVKSIYDAITLASIIEKEAGNDADRPIVSGIFHNRLKVNFPLQSDITIHFIKNDDETYISIADTKIQSPYNTYLNAGLTPTPINNPGISSIKAAINPTNNDYFYFIYDEKGTLYYAKTYEEHLNNVNKYL